MVRVRATPPHDFRTDAPSPSVRRGWPPPGAPSTRAHGPRAHPPIRGALPLAILASALVGSGVCRAAGAPPEVLAASTDSTKAQCLDAYSEAQRLRKSGKLVAARAELLQCAQDDCPQVTKADCVPWLRDVERAIPTLVVVAKDRRGRDTTEVRVIIDGELVAERLDGRAIPLDPGAHELRFEHGVEPAIERQVVIQESVKDRRIDVSFAGEGADATTGGVGTAEGSPSGTQGPTTDGAADSGASSAVATAGWVLTGFGAVGLGLFAALGLVGRGEVNDYQDSCAPTKTCNEDDVSSTRAKLVAADVSLGVGLAALTTGLILVIYDAARDDETSAAATTSFGVGPLPGGAAGQLVWRF